MDDSYQVRKAVRKDSKRIWEIRNSPEAREISNHKPPISFESHVQWFEKKYFSSNENCCYVLTFDKNVVGYCRFDRKEDVYVISIALDSQYLGKGLGTFFLKEALSIFDIPGIVEAEIELGNIPSVKLFESAGFTRLKQEGDFLRYQFRKSV